MPDFSVIQTTEPQTCWQTGSEWLLVIDPPLSALCVTHVQELDMILISGDIAAPCKWDGQDLAGSTVFRQVYSAQREAVVKCGQGNHRGFSRLCLQN